MSTSYDHARFRTDAALRVENLLTRYADLNSRELDELIELFPRLAIVDKALMTADERLSASLATFQRDHGRRLRVPAVELVLFLTFPIIVASAALCWLLL